LKENFDRFNFLKSHKEKEMNFRRWFTALAVLTLFVSLAAAQDYGNAGGPVVCSSTSVIPQLRTEGVTELVGDIIIQCTGGNAAASGTVAISQINVAVTLSASAVTSRLAPGGVPPGASGTPSEALLLVDEPGMGKLGPVPNYGPFAAPQLCPSPTGCVEYPTLVNVPGLGDFIVATAGSHGSTYYTGAADPGPNVFQGNLQGNVVTFQGVPFLPPVTSGVVRTFHITNIRVNPNSVAGPVNATVVISGPNTASSYYTNTVGVAAPSMTPSITNVGAQYGQCTPQTAVKVATLNFTESFPNAFKTRIAPIGTFSSYLGTTSAAYYTSSSPDAYFASESGYIFPASGVQAGLADFGTRLKANFANLPSGVSVYVTGTSTNTAPLVLGGYNPSQAPYALLLTQAAGEAGAFVGQGTGLYQINPTGQTSAEVVWEVVNANSSVDEDFTFDVYITYSANYPSLVNSAGLTTTNDVVAAGGTAPTVTMAYAPTSTNANAAIDAYTTANAIPRFEPGNGVLYGFISIYNNCKTVLLFPYLTSIPGWDSGIAVSNTSKDPWSTSTSTGNCTLNFYGSNAPTAAVTLPADGVSLIAPGTSSATLLSSIVTAPAGFTGYMFATCNFQFAHGYAFISDFGLRNWATDYLALVVTNNQPQVTYRGGVQSTVPAAETYAH
jgi:hypothetical protein